MICAQAPSVHSQYKIPYLAIIIIAVSLELEERTINNGLIYNGNDDRRTGTTVGLLVYSSQTTTVYQFFELRPRSKYIYIYIYIYI